MGFIDRIFGAQAAGARDDRTIEFYRHLLRTCPAETIEQVHAEAFELLTDGQRALVYEELSRGAGTGERPLSSEPATLARASARAELRRPGALERALSGRSAGVTPGAPAAGSPQAAGMLHAVARFVVASPLVGAFLPWDAAYGDGTSASAGERSSRTATP